MATPKEVIKPFYPLKQEFVASLDRFAQAATALADTAKMLLDLDVISISVATLLQERVDAFNAARLGPLT